MTRFMSRNPNSKYSAHGSELIGNCVFIIKAGSIYRVLYAILNLINFLKFKESASNQDFIGANKFKEFIGLIKKKTFQQFFPSYPFGERAYRTSCPRC